MQRRMIEIYFWLECNFNKKKREIQILEKINNILPTFYKENSSPLPIDKKIVWKIIPKLIENLRNKRKYILFLN